MFKTAPGIKRSINHVTLHIIRLGLGLGLYRFGQKDRQKSLPQRRRSPRRQNIAFDFDASVDEP